MDDFQGFNFNFGDAAGGRANNFDADLFADLFGGTRGARGKRPARGEDVAANVTIPLNLAATGGSARVMLPNGKALDVAIPKGVEDGKAIRLRGQGGGRRRRRAMRWSPYIMRPIRSSRSRGAT